MVISISGYNFKGPFGSSDQLASISGVYVVGYWISTEQWHIIYVGESADIKNRIKTHERKECWRQHAGNNYQFCVYYTPEAGRMLLEEKILEWHNPPCNKK